MAVTAAFADWTRPEDGGPIPVTDERLSAVCELIKTKTGADSSVGLHVDLTANSVVCTVARKGMRFRSRVSFDSVGELQSPRDVSSFDYSA